MKRMLILAIPLAIVCCLLLTGKAFAASNSDIEINVTTPIDSLQNESGVVAVEQFPAQIAVSVTAKTGLLTSVQLGYSGQSRKITPEYMLNIENMEVCGPYTITAETDQGAVLIITVNVVLQIKAAYATHY